MTTQTKTAPESKYVRGQLVEAMDPSTRQWRPGYVSEPAPYYKGKCDGAYVNWLDVPKGPDGISYSSGGWQSERTIREPRGGQ